MWKVRAKVVLGSMECYISKVIIAQKCRQALKIFMSLLPSNARIVGDVTVNESFE